MSIFFGDDILHQLDFKASSREGRQDAPHAALSRPGQVPQFRPNLTTQVFQASDELKVGPMMPHK